MNKVEYIESKTGDSYENVMELYLGGFDSDEDNKEVIWDVEKESVKDLSALLSQWDSNNGWIKVTEKSDLPTKSCQCFIREKSGKYQTGKWVQAPDANNDNHARNFWLARVSHYKLIVYPEIFYLD